MEDKTSDKSEIKILKGKKKDTQQIKNIKKKFVLYLILFKFKIIFIKAIITF